MPPYILPAWGKGKGGLLRWWLELAAATQSASHLSSLSNRDFLLFVLRAQDPVSTPASPPSPPDSASAPSTTPASPAAPAQPCGSGNATSDSGNGGGPSPVAAEGPPSATASILCKPLGRRAQACVYWGGVGLHKDKEQQPLLLVPRGAYAKLGVGDQFTMVSRISAAKGEMG